MPFQRLNEQPMDEADTRVAFELGMFGLPLYRGVPSAERSQRSVKTSVVSFLQFEDGQLLLLDRQWNHWGAYYMKDLTREQALAIEQRSDGYIKWAVTSFYLWHPESLLRIVESFASVHGKVVSVDMSAAEVLSGLQKLRCVMAPWKRGQDEGGNS